MATKRLLDEIAELVAEGMSIEVTDVDGYTLVVVHRHPLPASYNKNYTDLLIKVPIAYPNGNPDMFWVEDDVLKKNGQQPTKADQIEENLGRKWRRFSWHPRGWNPGIGSIQMYLEFVNAGLIKAAI